MNQLSKQNDSASHNKTYNIISTQTKLITDSKSTESSTISEKRNTERVKNEKKIKRTSIQNNLPHYTKILTMHLLKQTLTVVKIIHRLRAVATIQKARNRW